MLMLQSGKTLNLYLYHNEFQQIIECDANSVLFFCLFKYISCTKFFITTNSQFL